MKLDTSERVPNEHSFLSDELFCLMVPESEGVPPSIKSGFNPLQNKDKHKKVFDY